MKRSQKNSQEPGRQEKWRTLLLIGFACLTITACAQAPLTMSDPTMQGQQASATLELQDQAMLFEDVSGMSLSGKTSHHSDVSPTVRSLQVSPGTYQVSLVYEHLAQPKCWKDSQSKQCWKVRDRGWWLPGTTLIPGTIDWVAEPGKTYTVTRMEDYWSMSEKPSWSPKLSLAKVE